MLSYQVVDERVKALAAVSRLAAKKQLLIESLATEQRDFIHRNVFISMVGASTRIENAVLTDSEVDWIDIILSSDAKPTAYLKQQDFIKNKLSKDKNKRVYK